MFAHLHVHSNFSFHDGTMHPHEIVERAVERGYSAVALTDTNGIHAAVPFYECAREKGLRPILGAEVDDPASGERAVVLARDRAGYATVNRIVTERQLQPQFRLREALREARPDVVVLTASETILQALAGREGLYAELVVTGAPEARASANRLHRRARELGVPVAATGAVRFADPGDHDLHRLVRAIGDLSTWSRVDPSRLASPEAWLKPPDAMRHVFRGAPEAIRNAEAIAEECAVDLDLGRWKFPPFPVPEFETAESWLQRIALAGFARRFPEPTEEARRRFARELSVIHSMGFSSYFLVVWDIARRVREMGIPCLGRGSAACSLVAYALEITHVDPIRYDLYFERFLNPSRLSPPDIDLDLAWSSRDRVLDEVYAAYGADRVAMISTTNRYAARSAFREVAKALGIPEREVSGLTRRFPWGRAEALAELGSLAECRDLPLDGDVFRTILVAGARLADFPRHLGIHCGGIVISPDPLTNHVALARSAKGLVVTQPDMGPVEKLGLIKIDLLGNRSLGVLPDALAAVRAGGHPEPDLSDHERLCRDPETRALIQEGRTMGCFYVESPAMRSLLRKLRVDDYLGLVAASSIIRPGVAQSGMMQEYVRRRADPSCATYLHPKMAILLRETLGVMVYQEDVIKVAHEIGGLSLAEADLLRRAMSGKTRSSEAFGKVQGRFLTSSRRQGIAPDVATEIWRQIESFAGYSFCKAHSASFARLSYQVAWLKAHHPAEFMAAVLANGGGFYGPWGYVNECRRMGLDVRGPDVNRSGVATVGTDRVVQLGLQFVKGLSEESATAIVEAVAERPIDGVADLLARAPVGWNEAATLVRVGALDSLEVPRTRLLWDLARLQRRAGRSDAASASLFPDADEPPAPLLDDFDEPTRWTWEIEILGFTVSVHPLDLLASRIPEDAVRADGIDRCVGRRVRMAGWYLADKPIRTRGKGDRMKILSLEDPTGTFEVVLFPKVYERYASQTYASAFVVEGRVEAEAGVATLVADRIEALPGPSDVAGVRSGSDRIDGSSRSR